MNIGSQAEKTSAVESLELRFTPIVEPQGENAVGYRGETLIYTSSLGTLTEGDYLHLTDYGNNTGIRLTLWNIAEALRHIGQCEKLGVRVGFLSVKCSSSFCDLPDAYDRVRILVERSGLHKPIPLCLEFPESMLYRARENGRRTILDMKLLGVQTMMSGCGAPDCPTAKLLTVPVDYVLLEPSTTALLSDRNKPGVLAKFVTYLRSMNLKVLAEDAQADDDLRELSRLGVIGATLAKTYEGNSPFTDAALSIDEILDTEDEDDG